MQLSKEIEEVIHGDKAVLHYLEICRLCFIDGDKTALFGVIRLCAQYQAIIPDWATDEILKIEPLISSGELRDFNCAFGFRPANLATLKKNARQKKYTNTVLGLLQKYRLEGSSLNADDIFQTIADELGISRRDVNDIYKKEGQFIKALPKGNSGNLINGFGRMELPNFRRSGRAVLKD